MAKPVQPWPAGTGCPEPQYPDFAKALGMASHHFADDSGKEWGAARLCMNRAAEIAIAAQWPYWAMKRMYAEIGPLPTFDSFMETYCKALHTRRAAPDLAEAARGAVEFIGSLTPDNVDGEKLKRGQAAYRALTAALSREGGAQ